MVMRPRSDSTWAARFSMSLMAWETVTMLASTVESSDCAPVTERKRDARLSSTDGIGFLSRPGGNGDGDATAGVGQSAGGLVGDAGCFIFHNGRVEMLARGYQTHPSHRHPLV